MDKITIERETLLPCPFCGAEAEIITLEGETDNPSIGAQCVQCTNSACGSAGGLIYPLMDDVRHLLLERWNRRAALAQKAEPTEGAIVVSKNEAGQIVCVSRQDEDGRFLSIIAESADAPPAPAAVPLTKEQRELFDLILHHYGPDKRLQPLRDLIAAAGDKP